MATEDDEILFGKLAIKNSFITESQLEKALQDQDFYTPGTPLGEILVDKGFITRDQLSRLLEAQKKNLDKKDRYLKDHSRKDTLFGKIAIRLGFIDDAQLNWCLRAQGKDVEKGVRKRLGTYLIEHGFLSHEQVKKILREQDRGLMECPDCDRRYNIIGFNPEKTYTCSRCGVALYRVGQEESDADAEIEDLKKLDL